MGKEPFPYYILKINKRIIAINFTMYEPIDGFPVYDRLDGLVFRGYREGDEKDRAELFNYSFQTNGMGFLTTPKRDKWRYIEYPGSDPELIQLAVDERTGKIVGSVMGNLQTYIFGGKEYTVGVINDVATFPGYGKRGIARNLLFRVLNGFIRRNADFALLSADPKGFPRSRLYIPTGFRDIFIGKVIVGITDPGSIVRGLPPFLPFLPGLSFPILMRTLFYGRYIGKIRGDGVRDVYGIRGLDDLKLIIVHGYSGDDFRIALNRAYLKYFDGVHIYTPEEWQWARNTPTSRMYSPTEVTLRTPSGDIVGGAVFHSQNIYASKMGIKIRLGVIKNLFVDFGAVGSVIGSTRADRCLFIYKILMAAVLKSSAERKNAFTIVAVAPNDLYTINAAISLGCFTVTGAAYMIMPLKKGLKPPELGVRPFFTDPGVEMGSW